MFIPKLEQIKPSVSKRLTIARGATGFDEADETIEDDDEDERPEDPFPFPPELPTFFFCASTIFSKMMNDSCCFSTVEATCASVSFAASLARACASAKRSSRKGTTSMERTAETFVLPLLLALKFVFSQQNVHRIRSVSHARMNADAILSQRHFCDRTRQTETKN